MFEVCVLYVSIGGATELSILNNMPILECGAENGDSAACYSECVNVAAEEALGSI